MPISAIAVDARERHELDVARARRASRSRSAPRRRGSRPRRRRARSPSAPRGTPRRAWSAPSPSRGRACAPSGVLRVVDVLHVEVGDVGGRHDDAAALLHERAGELRRVALGLDEAPVLPDGAAGQLARGAHLVPADDRLAGRGAGLRHPPHEVEVVVVGWSTSDSSPPRCSHGPGVSSASSRVTSARNRSVAVGALGRGAERREADLDALVRRGCDAVAVQLGVGAERRVRVPGQVDLGHDRDEPLGGVLDDAAVVVLRVEAAAVAAHRGRGADARELGPRVDLGCASPGRR